MTKAWSPCFADTHDDVTALNRRARVDLILESALRPGQEIELHDDTTAGIGDTVVTHLNNRNLRTFEVSLQQTLDLLPDLAGKTVVTESGIRNKEDVDFMRSHGVHTFLIGETFMRADDIEAEVKKLF